VSKEQVAPGAATGSRITLTVDAVIPIGGFEGSRLFRRGEPTPYRDISEVPGPLRGFVVAPDDSLPEESEERFGNYELNVIYSVNSDGSRGRAIRRQIAELSNALAEQEWAEDEARRQGELPEETRDALQAAHDAAIALETKQLEIYTRDRDAAIAAAQDAAAREGEPAKPSPLFVRRGAVYRKAEEARLRPGEPVYQRQPSGEWWVAGQVNANGGLPPPEVTL
jgi:hypothetical protein